MTVPVQTDVFPQGKHPRNGPQGAPRSLAEAASSRHTCTRRKCRCRLDRRHTVPMLLWDESPTPHFKNNWAG